MNKEVATDSLFTYEVDEGLLICHYHKARVDMAAAKLLVQERLAMTQQRDYAAVVDYTKMKSTTKEARDYLANAPEAKQGIKALAIVLTSAVGKMTLNLFLRFSRPPYPTRAFTNLPDAKAWAMRYR